jgi:hypothetical protein
MQNKRSTRNLNEVLAISDKALKQELETLAIQLGKEEVILSRPISLHLFTNDELKCTNSSSLSDATAVTCDKETVDKEVVDSNESINEYKNKLIDNINSDFSDNDGSDKEALDLMKMLDVL